MNKTIIIMIIISSQIISAQTVFRSKFKPISYEQLNAPLKAAQEKYDNNSAKVDALINWIFELKKNTTETEFTLRMDYFYKELKSYYEKDLDLARMDTQIKQVELGIKEAIDNYNRRIQIANSSNSDSQASNNADYYTQLAYTDYKNNNSESAYTNLEKAIELKSSNQFTYFLKGLLEATLKKNSEVAIEYFTKAIEINNSYTDAYLYRGITYQHKNKGIDAIKDFTMCLKFDNKNTNALYARAQSKSRFGDYSGAISDYEQVLTFYLERPLGFDKNLADTYNEMAWCYFLSKDNTKCLEFANKAIAINEKHYNAIDTRGCAYYELGEFNKCISDMTKAIELNLESKNSYYYRGLAYIKINKKDLACKDFSKAGELGEEKAYEAIRSYCK